MENVIFTNTQSVNSRFCNNMILFMTDVHFYPDDGTFCLVSEFFKVKEIIPTAKISNLMPRRCKKTKYGTIRLQNLKEQSDKFYTITHLKKKMHRSETFGCI